MLQVVLVWIFYGIVGLCIIAIGRNWVSNNTGKFKKNTLKERDVRKEISDFLGKDKKESKIILNNLNNAIGEPDQKEFEMTGREHFICSYDIIRKIQETCPHERYLEYAYNCNHMKDMGSNNGVESTAFVSIMSVMVGVVGITGDTISDKNKTTIILVSFIICAVWWIKCILRCKKKYRNDMFYLNIIEQVLHNNSNS